MGLTVYAVMNQFLDLLIVSGRGCIQLIYQVLMAMEKCTSFGNSKVYHPCNGVSPEGATLAS